MHSVSFMLWWERPMLGARKLRYKAQGLQEIGSIVQCVRVLLPLLNNVLLLANLANCCDFKFVLGNILWSGKASWQASKANFPSKLCLGGSGYGTSENERNFYFRVRLFVWFSSKGNPTTASGLHKCSAQLHRAIFGFLRKGTKNFSKFECYIFFGESYLECKLASCWKHRLVYVISCSGAYAESVHFLERATWNASKWVAILFWSSKPFASVFENEVWWWLPPHLSNGLGNSQYLIKFWLWDTFVEDFLHLQQRISKWETDTLYGP